ncbi:MAG: NADH-quinone oxidoreductase subunit N [Anaerolineae bacterium]
MTEISIPSFDLLIVAPEIAVLLTALLVMVVDLFLPDEHKPRLAWLGLVGVLAAAGLAYYIWDGSDAVLQDMLAADGYALFFHLAILVAAGLALLFSFDYVRHSGLPQGEYYALLLLSTAGMMLMAASVNLMTIFISLEILSLALYALVGLDRGRRRSGEAALKYFLLGALASGFLLYGMALVYGQAGTLSLAGVRQVVTTAASTEGLLLVGLGLMVVGFGFKVALVPFQMWTPDVYEGAPTSVTAFMSVGAKAAGFAALGRVALYAFGARQEDWVWVLAVLAALTMTLGNLAALRQASLKRMLAYSSIAHAGYILVGVAAGNAAGTSGVLFYLLAYAFMNVGAFSLIIAAGQRLSSGVGAAAAEGAAESPPGEALEDLAGLASRKPGLALAMALFMLSLAGIPPLAGFLGKLYVFGAAVQAGLTWLAIVGVLNSVISAYYYLRVVAYMYMRPEPSPAPGAAPAPFPVSPALQVGLGLAAAAVVVLGIWPGPILDLARMAAASLLGG